jgi:hypothetical protein
MPESTSTQRIATHKVVHTQNSIPMDIGDRVSKTVIMDPVHAHLRYSSFVIYCVLHIYSQLQKCIIALHIMDGLFLKSCSKGHAHLGSCMRLCVPYATDYQLVGWVVRYLAP